MYKVFAAYGLAAALLYAYITTSYFVISVVLFAIYLITGGWEFADVFIKTVSRDLR